MNKWFMIFILILVTLFSLALFAARVLYSGKIAYLFLPWNLFLAWLPLLFAMLAVSWRRRPFLVFGAAFLWLLFLPNAPYLVTDLIHLRAKGPVPLWYDALLLMNFALLGLFLCFTSLRLMQGLVGAVFGTAAGWFFALSALSISGLGVYIGRFLRWNSWDLFTRPSALLYDIWANLAEPKTIAVSLLLALLMLSGYLVFSLTPALGSTRQELQSGS